MLLDGVHIPLTTPFYPDGRVYVRKLEHNVRRYSLTPVSGLIALGESSEAAALSDTEQRAVLQAVAETAAPEKVLTATLNHTGCDPALELSQYAAALRFDTLLLAAPAQLAGFHGELRTWFQVLADRAPLPCVIGGQCGAQPIPLEILAELATHPNVLGILEMSSHISRVAALREATVSNEREVITTVTFTAATDRMLRPIAADDAPVRGGFVSAAALAGGTALAAAPPVTALRTRTKRVSTQILWSHAADATEALRAGANGLAPAVAAAVPQAVFEIWAAWKDGDASLLREKQARVAVAEPNLLASGAPLLKAGAELSGYFGGRPRLPLVAPSGLERDALTTALSGMRS